MSVNDLTTILDIINTNVSIIEQTYAKHQTPIPSLNEPFKRLAFDESELIEATNLVVAAASQLIAILRRPMMSLVAAVGGQFITNAIGVAEVLSVPEILRRAGPKGLHVTEIANEADTDVGKLGRILRLLATVHIFQEVAPNVFANNRISSVMDSGKTLEEIKAKDDKGILNNKYRIGDSGITALIGVCTDEISKSGAYLSDYMADPSECKSIDVTHTPFHMAFKPDGDLFTWYQEPSNATRWARFNAAMRGSLNASPMNILSAFNWKSVTDGVVVDVGGGIGSSSLLLAKKYPHLRIVVQDTEGVIKDGYTFWEREYPESLADGRVQLQTHDFFKPQPVKNAAAFFLRFVLHDWPAEKAQSILKALRPSATPNTKLIVLDQILPHAVPGLEENNPGDKISIPPVPLLPNWGAVNVSCYMTDIHMMLCLNGQERTLGEWIAVTEGTGWLLEDIKRVKGATVSSLVFCTV